jgi:hypothetical protein
LNTLTTQQEKKLQTIRFFSKWMDAKFTIPGTSIKFGLDAIIGLVPGIGDLVGTGISIGIFGLILKEGVPLKTAFKMMVNIVVDAFFSTIPLAGSVFDVLFKANMRNLHLLENHINSNPTGKYHYGIWWLFGITIGASFVILIGFIALFIYLIATLF